MGCVPSDSVPSDIITLSWRCRSRSKLNLSAKRWKPITKLKSVISYWHIILAYYGSYWCIVHIKEKNGVEFHRWGIVGGTGLWSRNPGHDVHQGAVEAAVHGDSSSAKCERSMGCFRNANDNDNSTKNGRVATALASCCSLDVPAKLRGLVKFGRLTESFVQNLDPHFPTEHTKLPSFQSICICCIGRSFGAEPNGDSNWRAMKFWHHLMESND